MYYKSLFFIVSASIINLDSTQLDLLSNVGMYDFGLAQINGDDDYDIYTINHAYAESFLMYDAGKFTSTSEHIPRSTTDTPLYEPVGRTPALKDGLNIFRPNNSQLFVYCQHCPETISGSLKVSTPVGDLSSIKLAYLELATATKKLNESADMVEVKFNLGKHSLMVLDVTFPDLNFNFDISLNPTEIHIGPTNMNPTQSSFTYSATDDHTMAWARLNQDKYTDVYMGTGGLRARIDQFNPLHVLQEKLMIYNPESEDYEDYSVPAGFNKGQCRTYQSSWIDYDNDGDLDLYLGCKSSKNKLYIQQGIGSLKFIESAKKYKLNHQQGDEFHWSDLNQDGQLDLILLAANKLHVYLRKTRKNSHVFRRVYTSPLLGKGLDSAKTNIKTIDADNSGFVEIYLSSYNPHNLKDQTRTFYAFDFDQSGSIFMLDTAAKFPEAQGHISFADINMDGRQDLISLEKNVLFQQHDQSFKPSNQLSQLFNDEHNNYRNIIWFDPEVNGKWNVLLGESYRTRSNAKRNLMNFNYRDIHKWNKLTHFKDLVANPNHNWLYIDLLGSTYNQNGIGAKIYLTSERLKQYIEVMGNHDTFRSQGHYRQYIGLGADDSVDVEVHWPDGQKTILKAVKASQLLKINHPDVKNHRVK